MRIVVIGAYGLIGAHVTVRLLGEDHEVVGIGREVAAAARRLPGVQWVAADLRRMDPARWRPIVGGAQAVVNCAGALQDSPRDDLAATHVKTVADLALACREAGVRRFVHISAAGAPDGVGRFGETKRAAEEALQASGLDWVILRPVLVIAPVAYGGGALLRGLAGFPGFIPAYRPGSILQTLSVEDLAEAAVRAADPAEPARFACDLAASEPTRLAEVLLALRAWLGLPPVRVVAIPEWAARAAGWTADGLAWLGWRSPLRSAALAQLAAGVRSREATSQDALGVRPRSLSDTLARHPSGVQERWFARLYFVKPLALATLAAFWALSGVTALLGHAAAAGVLTGSGLPAPLAEPLVVGGAVWDIALGALVCARSTAPFALKGMILLTGLYLAAASLWIPGLWADPLGPLLKAVPAAALAAATLAMMDER
jgi:uncharacterized protein YbjT (DUF2867 family)